MTVFSNWIVFRECFSVPKYEIERESREREDWGISYRGDWKWEVLGGREEAGAKALGSRC